MPQVLILSVGKDDALLHSRSAVLRKAGYVVAEETSLQRAISNFHEGDYDLVILCHSISAAERAHFEASVHRRSPGTPVVHIDRLLQDSGAESDGESPTEATIESAPQEFLLGLQHLVGQLQQQRGPVSRTQKG